MANSNGDDGWNHFIYKSNGGRYFLKMIGHVNKVHNIHYTHWLPKDPTTVLPQKLPDDKNLLPDFYENFDTLLHVTMCHNVVSILKKGFEPRPVRHNSVVNSETELLDAMLKPIKPHPLHPLRESKVMWYGPGKTSDLRESDHTVGRYGNVVFSMERLDGYEGIMRNGLKFYFIEVIEYVNKSACRILVSHKDYPRLKSFDPKEIGSPLYIDEEYRLYYISQLKRTDGNICPNDLEIMKEETDSWMQRDYHLNHCVSFTCTNEDFDIIGVKEPSLSDLLPYFLKLAIVLALGESKYEKRLSLLTPFKKREDRDKELKSELEKVHNEAVQTLQRREEEELNIEKVKQAFQNNTSVAERLMDSTVDIVDSYLDLLKQLPERSRTTLKDTLWEEIVKVLK